MKNFLFDKMDLKTNNSDHWGTNLMLTERAENEFTKLVKNSISDSVFLYNNSIKITENASTYLVDDNFESTYLDFYENPLKIDIPDFAKKYSVQGLRNYSSKTRKWFGSVVSIDEDKFTAFLEDLIKPGTREICEFDIYDISPDDRELLQIGATFYWTIGYSDNYGQRRKESIIRFRRLGHLTVNDINIIEDRAKELFDSIAWED